MTAHALCTSGLVGTNETVSDIQRALEAFACEEVVLDHALSPRLAESWLPLLLEGRPRPLAMIAPCPAPVAGRQKDRFRPEDARLASPDSVERAEALALIRPTLEAAERFNVPTVAIDGGPVSMGGAVRALQAFMEGDALDTPAGREVCADIRRQREALGIQAVDGLSFALEALIPEAEERGVIVALLETTGLAWAGAANEIASVLERFSGAPLTWWAQPLGRDRYETIDYVDAASAPHLPPPAAHYWALPPQPSASQRERIEQCVASVVQTAEPKSPAQSILATADGSRFDTWHRELLHERVES